MNCGFSYIVLRLSLYFLVSSVYGHVIQGLARCFRPGRRGGYGVPTIFIEWSGRNRENLNSTTLTPRAYPMGPRHHLEFTWHRSQSPINAPRRGPGVSHSCLSARSLVPGGVTGISPYDVSRCSLRCGSLLGTVDSVSLSGYMYLRVPLILSEHSTTISRPVQMVGKLATPFDPVLTPTLVAPTSPRCQQIRFLSAAQPSKEAVQTPIGSPLDFDSQVQG